MEAIRLCSLREKVFFPGNDITVNSQVGATYRKMCGVVIRIQWYLRRLSSSIRSEVMIAHRFTAHCSGRCGQRKFPMKASAPFAFFETVFRWSCIRVCEKVVGCFLSSFTPFADLGYHTISLLLCNADNWAWIGLELPTTTFAVLTLVCATRTSLHKI